MIESSEEPIALCRDFVPELLRVVAHGGDKEGSSWNAVDSLELLLDAGAFRDAQLLAESIMQMLGTDRRDRLFAAYLEYSLLMQGGPVGPTVARLEELFAEIQTESFSCSDRSWSAILLARALHVGVSTRSLSEGELIRARSVLSAEFNRSCEPHQQTNRIRVGLELTKTYTHAPIPETPAALALLESIARVCDTNCVRAEVVFDVQRALFSVSVGQKNDGSDSSSQLRSLAMPLGGVARGLAELAIGKSGLISGAGAQECFERALRLFEESSYRSGEFEAAISLARSAGEAEHHEKAYRFFTRADAIADTGGFVCGRGAALLGLFHCAVASNDTGRARAAIVTMQELLTSELFLCAFGLNIVGAYQVMGMHQEAVKLATRCQRIFTTKGMLTLTGQASHMLGASYAESGNWLSAQSAWKRSLVCDELGRNVFGACDRRAALAQAIAMTNFTQRGRLDDSTRKKVNALLTKSEEALAGLSPSTRAVEALGRTLQVHAQLAILDQNPVGALRYLNRAREAFVELDRQKEVSLIDGLTGLALLEASKAGGVALIDEAMMALQRSLDFFTSIGEARVAWKLRYYLAVAATLRSQQTSEALERANLRLIAVSLLDEASTEAERCSPELGMPLTSNGGGDFSPGLKPEALRGLRESLTLRDGRRERGVDAPEGGAKATRYRGYLH